MRDGHFLRIEEEILHPTRLIMTYIINTNVGKKKHMTTPEKLMPLSFDKKQVAGKAKPLSEEEIKKMLQSRNFRPNENGEYRLAATLTKTDQF